MWQCRKADRTGWQGSFTKGKICCISGHQQPYLAEPAISASGSMWETTSLCHMVSHSNICPKRYVSKLTSKCLGCYWCPKSTVIIPHKSYEFKDFCPFSEMWIVSQYEILGLWPLCESSQWLEALTNGPVRHPNSKKTLTLRWWVVLKFKPAKDTCSTCQQNGLQTSRHGLAGLRDLLVSFKDAALSLSFCTDDDSDDLEENQCQCDCRSQISWSNIWEYTSVRFLWSSVFSSARCQSLTSQVGESK